MLSAQNPQSPGQDRRTFLVKAATLLAGALALLPAVGAGLMVLVDPLRRQAGQTRWARVATLGAIPADGSAHKFSVVMDRVDAWNKASNVPVGAVYLRRTGEQRVEALNVVCPHAGCFVELRGEAFACPCHNSSFRLDGSIADRSSPSPRGLDTLEVELRNGVEVWVRFQNFQAGTKAKVPVG